MRWKGRRESDNVQDMRGSGGGFGRGLPGGFGGRQIRVPMGRGGGGLSLSTIVILVGASDVLRWLEQGASPARPAGPVLAADVFRCHPEGPFGWKPGALASVELLRRARRRLLRPIRVEERAGRWDARSGCARGHR